MQGGSSSSLDACRNQTTVHEHGGTDTERSIQSDTARMAQGTVSSKRGMVLGKTPTHQILKYFGPNFQIFGFNPPFSLNILNYLFKIFVFLCTQPSNPQIFWGHLKRISKFNI